MKKDSTMTMVVALMTTVCANAQQMFVKPMVGGTLSTVTKVDDAKMKLGLVGGAEFGYQLNDQFAVTAGLLVLWRVLLSRTVIRLRMKNLRQLI